MTEYRKVGNLFEGLTPHIVGNKAMPGETSDGTYFIQAGQVYTLDDGMELEICMWTDCEIHMTFVDVSIDKELFHSKGRTDFLGYLKEKGLYLDPVDDGAGKWRCGTVNCEKVYRLTYHDEDEV